MEGTKNETLCGTIVFCSGSTSLAFSKKVCKTSRFRPWLPSALFPTCFPGSQTHCLWRREKNKILGAMPPFCGVVRCCSTGMSLVHGFCVVARLGSRSIFSRSLRGGPEVRVERCPFVGTVGFPAVVRYSSCLVCSPGQRPLFVFVTFLLPSLIGRDDRLVFLTKHKPTTTTWTPAHETP